MGKTNKLEPTPLNYKKVLMRVHSVEVKKGGFFSSDYLQYTIETKPLGWSVKRRDTDFFTLRKRLTI